MRAFELLSGLFEGAASGRSPNLCISDLAFSRLPDQAAFWRLQRGSAIGYHRCHCTRRRMTLWLSGGAYKSIMPTPDHRYTILIRVDQVARLFNSLDPTPFRERDLDDDAERFIVEWAQEAPGNLPIEIVVQLPPGDVNSDQTHAVQQAVRYNFNSRANQARRELRDLLREGRRSLFIGIPILAVSLIASKLVDNASEAATFSRVFSESLVIFGWVANWRALEIFLYDWWPIVRRRRLYRRLAAAEVNVLSA
ncbi:MULTISPECIES: hypothetical protein [unclassified Sinorhizobium]|uniref:hypothetical protein n=1 Tax=unclassified Sinorhizobium TaxID=2613772 RepID=UPI0024C321C8|nr:MULTISPECIES: hypothetical protein [unclassified Sinorhizobium]MDK1373555.1 hypothetical protein [Sinorhizobium sp. 6-70]MDK1483072.1 hypothetical protein [Sinorhizobium sp. 6-117]